MEKWQEATEVATSSVAYAEALASFHRKQRESNIENSIMSRITTDFSADWIGFIRLQVNDELNSYVERALSTHPLRGFDAIHLASALALKDTIQQNIVFTCFDNKLLNAAREEGLQTFPDDLKAL